MSYVVVVLLSVVWLGFFLPSLLQARRTSSPYASATTFQDSLRRLSRPVETAQAPAAVSSRPRPPARDTASTARRRDVLAVLGASVAAGAVVSLGFDGVANWAPLPPLVLLLGYVVWLRQLAVRRQAARRTPVVAEASPLIHVAAEAEPPAIDAGGDEVVVLSVRRRELVGAGSNRIAG